MDTKSLHNDSTITNWDEAIPLGNGDIGCLIWNTSNSLRLSMDKGGIWDCSNPPENQNNFCYQNIQDLVKNKKSKQLRKKYDDCYNNVTPTKLPAGKIILDLGISENVVSNLSFETAEASLSAGNIRLKTFLHACDNYGIMEINKTDIKVNIENPKYGKPKKPIFQRRFRGITQTLKNLHYPVAEFFTEKNKEIEYQYFIQPTDDRFYGIMTAKTEIDGKTIIAYTVGVGKSTNFVDECRKILEKAIKNGYNSAFNEHCKWWSEYWSKSTVSLPDKLLEKQWYLNNYLLGSCSRKNCCPMPLQGVWTADNNSLPPWKGDYHHDLNTQMSYTSYLKANRLEQGECFIDYLLNMSQAGKNFAKNFYKTDGICLPSVMDIEGHALGGWCQYALSPTNQLWLCQIMARYCYFTQNDTYIHKIYNYMREVGKFLLGILKENNGFYKLPLSSSPEIHDNTIKSWLTPNSNYDLALMRNFAEDMIHLSGMLNDIQTQAEWQQHLKKFEPLAIDKNNVLMLSPDESPYCSHRHHSHCMSIYPLKTLEYTDENSKKIIDSTISDLEKHGISEWVGYSFGWMAQLYIAKGDGENACKMLHDFFEYTCTSNGFHINGDYKKMTQFKMKYRLFTLEGNFIATDAIQNMLLYSEREKIKLFPAIPESWKDVEFDTFRAYGGVLVSSKMKNGIIVYLKLEATADCKIIIENDLSHLKTDNQSYFSKEFIMKKGEFIIFS